MTLVDELHFPRVLMSEIVYVRLLREIITGARPGGSRVRLDEIAAELGISRTPIREAVNRLVTAGFVDVTRNSPTAVAEWGVEDMRQRVSLIAAVASGALRSGTELHLPTIATPAEVTSPAEAVLLHLDLSLALYEAAFGRVRAGTIHDAAEALRVYCGEARVHELPRDLEAVGVQLRSALMRRDRADVSVAMDAIRRQLDAWMTEASPRAARPR